MSDTTASRPALRYFGSKWRLTPWIIEHFAPYDVYVEPFAGGAGVLLRKPPSALEVYNDLDGEVVNFFDVLRNETDELIRRIDLTRTRSSGHDAFTSAVGKPTAPVASERTGLDGVLRKRPQAS